MANFSGSGVAMVIRALFPHVDWTDPRKAIESLFPRVDFGELETTVINAPALLAGISGAVVEMDRRIKRIEAMVSQLVLWADETPETTGLLVAPEKKET